MPRFDQSFSGLCEQNLQDTLQLKQRYLDAKAKRAPKGKQDKKQQDPIQGSVHVQQKFLKRPPSDDPHECGVPAAQDVSGGGVGAHEPPVKLQCTAQPGGGGGAQDARHVGESAALTKFSVEIVQQLEFTTSAASSQPQQISTNVTVKTHANASVKSDVVPTPKEKGGGGGIGLDVVGTLGVERVKQEPDNDFADLDQCAAALEKDAAANGGAACFGGFSDLIGDDTNDEIISSATFNDLISDISNYPDYELMKDFDFEEKHDVKADEQHQKELQQQQQHQQHQQLQHHHHHQEMKLQQHQIVHHHHQQQQQHHHQHQQQNSHYQSGMEQQQQQHHLHQQQQKPNVRLAQQQQQQQQSNYAASVGGAQSPAGAQVELSPAAQTLKQMAEQHHKNQLSGLASFQGRTRSPYADFAQYQGAAGGGGGGAQDYQAAQQQQQQQQAYAAAQQKSNAPASFPLQPDMIKQEMIFQGGEFDMKRKQSVYKQQYSPYGSPGGHGSPGYLPGRAGGASAQGGGGAAQFGGGTPPRPPSGPGGGGAQGGPGGGGGASAGGGGSGAGVATASVQINQAQQLSISQQNHGGHTIQVSAGQHVHLSGDLKGGNVSIAAQQGMHFTQGQAGGAQQQQQQAAQGQQQQPQQQQQPAPQQQQQQHHNSPLQGGLNSPNPMGGNQSVAQMGSPMQMPTALMGGAGGGQQQQQHPGVQQLDGYSMSQTQTINFTQQSLRRSGNGPGLTIGPGMAQQGGASAPSGRLLNAQSIEQQKLLHQQHMLRAQQQAAAAAAAAAAMQQQQQQQQQQMAAAAAAAAAATRPPPPDYKAAAMMQPRYATAGGARRMPHQPMPPSGPMIRSNMYMLQQQQQQQQQHQHLQQQQRAAPPTLYRQQPQATAAAMLDQQQHNPSEWRHLLMSQQQNTSFGGMRPPQFQQGFNMASGGMQQQMTALQHQQMRAAAQQNLLPVQQQQQPQMQQMSHMNQAAMLHMQQQQSLMQQQQQQQQHMSLSSIHMQQSQSMSMGGSPSQQQPNGQQSSAQGCFNPQADFNFEFLDNLTGGDGSSTFTDQELLNSFDSDAGFNLDF